MKHKKSPSRGGGKKTQPDIKTIHAINMVFCFCFCLFAVYCVVVVAAVTIVRLLPCIRSTILFVVASNSLLIPLCAGSVDSIPTSHYTELLLHRPKCGAINIKIHYAASYNVQMPYNTVIMSK